MEFLLKTSYNIMLIPDSHWQLVSGFLLIYSIHKLLRNRIHSWKSRPQTIIYKNCLLPKKDDPKNALLHDANPPKPVPAERQIKAADPPNDQNLFTGRWAQSDRFRGPKKAEPQEIIAPKFPGYSERREKSKGNFQLQKSHFSEYR